MEKTFLHIESLSDLMPFIKDKPEFKVMKQENGTQVVSYIIATSESFNNIGSLECRGITFDHNGKIICRPLHKFFNVNERESTQAHVLPWSTVHRVMDKRDGSMINTCEVNGQIRVKTKKSFTSDVAKVAQVWFDNNSNYVDFARKMVELNCTPTFEYTSPSNRIVLAYEEDEMTLLHVRHNFTGEYWTQEHLNMFAMEYGIKMVELDSWNGSTNFLAEAKNVKGIEGWVIQFRNGDMVKLKTEEYLVSHRLITFVRERDVAEMVLNENLDDVKSAMLERNISLEKLHNVEHRVLTMLRELEVEVDEAYEMDKNMSRKDFASKYTGHKYFGLIMQRYSGNEPDYVDYFKKRLLKEHFGLTSV